MKARKLMIYGAYGYAVSVYMVGAVRQWRRRAGIGLKPVNSRLGIDMGEL